MSIKMEISVLEKIAEDFLAAKVMIMIEVEVIIMMMMIVTDDDDND